MQGGFSRFSIAPELVRAIKFALVPRTPGPSENGPCRKEFLTPRTFLFVFRRCARFLSPDALPRVTL